MSQRPAISIYPANAATWAHSGWEHNSTTPPSVSDLSDNKVLGKVPGGKRVTQWWAHMSTLQLRGFILAVLVLVGISTSSLVANYWLLRAGNAPLYQSAWQGGASESATDGRDNASRGGSGGDGSGGGGSDTTGEGSADESAVRTVTITAEPSGAMPSSPRARASTRGSASGNSASRTTSTTTGLINVNTASAPELEALPGVGPTTAQAIIDYRTTNGPFSSVDELLAVDGIGKGKLAKIRNYATI